VPLGFNKKEFLANKIIQVKSFLFPIVSAYLTKLFLMNFYIKFDVKLLCRNIKLLEIFNDKIQFLKIYYFQIRHYKNI